MVRARKSKVLENDSLTTNNIILDESENLAIDIPVEATPKEVPVEETPEDVPIEATPKEVPVEETPKEVPVEATPEDVPVEATPEDVPIEATPEEVPVEETPEEVPVEVPVEATPEEVPVEQTPDVIPEPTECLIENIVEPSENISPISQLSIESNSESEPNITMEMEENTNIVPSIIFIVPYRNRQKQYEFFSNHMKMILEDYDINSYKILYIHQQDNREFNRGAIKNLGFIAVKNMYPDDYQNITLVFNDVDTMPYTKNFIDYNTTQGVIKHFYGFTFTLGGIVSIKASDFEKINGFPNLWSWGFEDNMLQDRVKNAGLTIDRSQFYPILDSNILHFPDGFSRNVNRNEFDQYIKTTTEGINTILDIQYNYEESTGFINVTNFNTQRIAEQSQTFAYDLRNGTIPFKQRTKRGGTMKMIL